MKAPQSSVLRFHFSSKTYQTNNQTDSRLRTVTAVLLVHLASVIKQIQMLLASCIAPVEGRPTGHTNTNHVTMIDVTIVDSVEIMIEYR